MSTEAPLRLAIRQEGRAVNAYAARLDTMDGALLIGTVNARLCHVDRAVFTAFQQTMTLALAALLKDALGITRIESIQERPAPEHERAGHA